LIRRKEPLFLLSFCVFFNEREAENEHPEREDSCGKV
jgi:hypothetical protein